MTKIEGRSERKKMKPIESDGWKTNFNDDYLR